MTGVEEEEEEKNQEEEEDRWGNTVSGERWRQERDIVVEQKENAQGRKTGNK